MQRKGMVHWLSIAGALLLGIGLAQAKGPPSKIVISGPGLLGQVEVTNAQLLQRLGMGALEDLAQGVIAAPAPGVDLAERYRIDRYHTDSAGKGWPFDRIYYYPNRSGAGGYIFYEGLTPFGGRSEYDGKWFRATAAGDGAMQQLLAHLRRSVSSVPRLPATGKTTAYSPTLLAIPGGLLLTGLLLHGCVRPAGSRAAARGYQRPYRRRWWTYGR